MKNNFVPDGVKDLKQHRLSVATVVFMIFCLVSAGCYGIEEMIPESGPGLTLVMLLVLPLIWALPFGLVASELGSLRPQEGGYYKWVQEALGEFWGFQAGWWRTISIYIDNSLYVILAGGYIAAQWNLSPTTEFAIKALIVIIFTVINLRGVKDVGEVSTVLSILIMLSFAMVAVCGFLNWQGNPLEPFTAGGAPLSEVDFADGVYYIGMGLAIGMWMYSGYESMSTMAGELSDPQVIPKATIITIPLIALCYILPTMAGLASLGQWESWGTEAGTIGYSDVITTFWSPALGVIFVIVAVLAQCSIFNTYIASGSRGFFTLAGDHLAPRFFTKCDKKHGVPTRAVLSVGVVNLILCNFAFEQVVIVDVFLLSASYVMVYISALILRKKVPQSEYKFRIPGGFGFLVVLCAVPILVAISSFFLNGVDYFIGGMLGILSGPIMYVLWKRRYGGLAKLDAQTYPIDPRTRLVAGDGRRIGGLLAGLGAVGLVAVPWLQWFEGGWGPDFYLDKYGSGLLADFSGMLTAITILGVVCLLSGLFVWLRSRRS